MECFIEEAKFVHHFAAPETSGLADVAGFNEFFVVPRLDGIGLDDEIFLIDVICFAVENKCFRTLLECLKNFFQRTGVESVV